MICTLKVYYCYNYIIEFVEIASRACRVPKGAANLQNCVNPQNAVFRNHRKNGMAKQAGENFLAGLSIYLRPLCCREALFHAGVVDAQELRSSGNHVDIVVLSLGSLPIHEGVHGVSLVLALQYNGAYSEQCSP